MDLRDGKWQNESGRETLWPSKTVQAKPCEKEIQIHLKRVLNTGITEYKNY